MFLQASVCPRGGMACMVAGGVCMVGGHAWSRGGACVAEGVCVAGGHAWLGGVHGQGGMHDGWHAWQGACVAGGVCMVRGCVWQGVCMAGGHAWQGGMHGRGACMVGGMHGRGHAWPGEACMASGGMHGQRGGMHDEDMAGQCMGGTHPTGMHSCSICIFLLKRVGAEWESLPPTYVGR